MTLRDAVVIARIVKKFGKIKGDMVVFQNISRKKNKECFDELERFIKGHQQ